MSSMDPTDIWAWTYEDAARLKHEGGAKQVIVDGWNRFNSYLHRDAVAADLAIYRALSAAHAEGELRWELLLRHRRLQLWLNHDLKKALPEAIDLLTLATDERLRDVPERICAVHDIVECQVRMDGAGYYENIVANAEDVLAQLPERHSCASCARLNLAGAASAAGRSEEAENWIARFQANLHRPKESLVESTLDIAQVYEWLGKWEESEREYSAAEASARSREPDSYIDALLGLARVQAKTGKAVPAAQALGEALHFTKYSGGSYLLARLVETEGWVAEAAGHTDAALDYFVRAAKQYLELGRYRFAALTSLHAAELSREQGGEEAEVALEVAALAVGAMPPASQDVYQRLERLGRSPVSVSETTTDSEASSADGRKESALLPQQERVALEETLAAHLHTSNTRGVAMALYRLGHWYAIYDQPRAALDYLISNAVLERLLRLSMDDREDALNVLKGMQQTLPPGTILAALAEAMQSPSTLLAPLLDKLPAERWRWLVQSVANDVEDRPVVEPEPVNNDPQQAFEAWLEHAASMTVLIVRFREHIEADRCQLWVSGLDKMAEDIDNHLGPSGQGHELAKLARGLADLARGADAATVGQQVLPPFNPVIDQVVTVAKLPVWQHPGSSPLDLLVEQAAQRAVRGLRIHDDNRATGLANLAWRFELMTLDLEQHTQTQAIGSFLTALSKLMLADGDMNAIPDVSLQEPFGTILSAIVEAGSHQAEAPAAPADPSNDS
jgi:tetratricopeptide (TPR) repeat protein